MTRTLYAMLVGIDTYQYPVPALGGCVNDIDAVGSLLQEFGRAGGFNIDLHVLKNDQATRSNVIAGFREHLCKAGTNDAALFYYSGHGSQENAPPEFWDIEPDRLNETLVCYDSRTDDSWDLADKELAVLIAEVAAGKPHILCVLDCCHSGNGTRATLEDGLAIRRAPTDRRLRPLESFLNRSLSAKRDNNTASADASWLDVPQGRHVLLAACRSSETAKEVNEDGKPHGAFTASLLATLRQTRGAISYRDLVKRAGAQVRLRVAEQVPQIEVSEQVDLLKLFLGGAVQLPRTTPTLSFDGQLGWTVDSGAIHGIPQPEGTETTSFAIFPLLTKPDDCVSLAAAVALANVRQVRPELSCVDVKPLGNGLDRNLTYQAILIATPLPPKRVHIVADAAASELIRQALASAGGPGNASLLVKETTAGEAADLRIVASATSYCIGRGTAERPLVAEIEGINEAGARLVVSRLEQVARWQAVATLKNSYSRLGDTPITITMRHPVSIDHGTSWVDADPHGEDRLYYTRLADGQWRAPRFRLTLTNTTEDPLYCALLWLGENFSVKSLFSAGAKLIPGKGTFDAGGGQSLVATIPDDKWKAGRTEITDHLKLIVSRDQFDPTLFNQEAIEVYSRLRSSRGPVRLHSVLERLAERVHTRDLSFEPNDDELVSDWTTGDLTITVVRPRDAVEVPPAGAQSALGAGVTLMGHANFRAQASLVSTVEVGRALGAFGTPAIFRDDPDLSQPFLFETARGTDPGLGALRLTEIENADAVTTATPLRLRVATSLAPGDRVIPYAWDGEFYLPLGIGRSVDGAVEIELRQIPVFNTAGDVERGIVSSIRILFQKIASPYLGIAFDYPQLSAVAFDADGRPVYEKTAALVRTKVAAARTILLYVHGILGDTMGMTAAAATTISIAGAVPESIASRYDLILAFDYENINTSIKDTARAVKERLAAVGISASDGKTVHVVAHSMGGLVMRWFIEHEGGNEIVQHLVTLGTPHAGSPWPTIENWATAALAIGLNGLSQVAWPLKLLGDLAGAVETIDVALDEMAPNSPFLKDLERGSDPKVPYTLLIGNTSIIPITIANGTMQALLARLSAQRVLHDVTAIAFLNKANDIAVSVWSAQSIAEPRSPAPVKSEVACDHITFFTTEAGRRALLEALRRA
ncbi:caspase family protein [Bradyrhizobium ganzhouense]|uniref:caspase family protein n=1 Tax=Bradyrhizobium ganzhouense TaxID=1179767 RepID=UPI003CFA57B3